MVKIQIFLALHFMKKCYFLNVLYQVYGIFAVMHGYAQPTKASTPLLRKMGGIRKKFLKISCFVYRKIQKNRNFLKWLPDYVILYISPERSVQYLYMYLGWENSRETEPFTNAKKINKKNAWNV